MFKWFSKRRSQREPSSPTRDQATRTPIRRATGVTRASFRRPKNVEPAQQPAPPMPSEDELNELFSKVVGELDLSADKRDIMMSLPPDKKWQIILSKADDNATGDTADSYVEDFNRMASMPFTHDINELAKRSKSVNHLKTALRTQPNSFVMRFIEIQGLEFIFKFLDKMDYDYRTSVIHTAVVGCIKAIMNNSHGRSHVMTHPRAIRIITQSLYCDNTKAKIAALEILAAVCLVPDGHKKVLVAMSHFQQFANERTRFQTVVGDLDRSSNTTMEDVSFQTTTMAFINAVLSYGPGEDSLEFRIHLRFEFLMLGLEPIVDKLRKQNNELVRRHLEFFASTRQNDEEAVANRFNQVHIDARSATSLVKALQAKLSHSSAYPHFLSVLNHALLIPDENRTLRWQLLSRVFQQIILQEEDSNDKPYDPDTAPLVIDVENMIKHLASENELLDLRNTLNRKSEALDETKADLSKKERECEVRLQEKEDIKTAMNKVMQKLEKENATVRDMKQREKEMSTQIDELRATVDRERGERAKVVAILEQASKGLTDSGKAEALKLLEDLKTAESAPPAPAPPPGPAPPPPPPPPLMGGPPPPPPPPGGPPGPPPPPGGPPGGPPPPPGLGGMSRLPAKKIPKPSVSLKSFNWSKIPDIKIEKTIWKDLNETRLVEEVDLAEVDGAFSAFQKDRTMSVSQSLVKQREVVTLIEARRAQNLTILLSKIKTNYEEIKVLVLQMDEEEIPRDMLEQLLKYTPLPDEMELLESHSSSDEIERFATADRFLYEVSKIPHYEQRLQTLYFKCKFVDSVDEVRPKLSALRAASQQVQNSQKFRKVLELVLLFGNYMNTGVRGNAYGFKISSLTKMVDTKSGQSGTRYTLLNFLLQVIEDRFPELLQLDEDLDMVRDAGRCSIPEVEKDVTTLRKGLDGVKKELAYQAGKESRQLGDRYVEVMGEFVELADTVFSDLDNQLKKMKEEYIAAVEKFGEDSKVASEEFFGIFNTFLSQFAEARSENVAARRKKEEEEKKLRQQEEAKQRDQDRKAKRKARHAAKAAGEFDDLVSALRSGDLYEEEKTRRTGAPPVARKVTGTGRSRFDSNKRER